MNSIPRGLLLHMQRLSECLLVTNVSPVKTARNAFGLAADPRNHLLGEDPNLPREGALLGSHINYFGSAQTFRGPYSQRYSLGDGSDAPPDYQSTVSSS